MLTALLAATLLNATYVSEACKFSFEYPSSWTVRTLPNCEAGLRPPGWRKEMRENKFDLGPYPVRVRKVNKSFLEAVRESYFDRTRNGRWEIQTRGVPWEAEEFRTACCQGLRGTSWARIWSRTHEVGTLVWEAALVNDRRGHSVIIESDRYERFRYVVTDIILSVRFQP